MRVPLLFSFLAAILFLLLNPIGCNAKVASGWYPGWHFNDFPPENIPWNQYSDVKYAFAFTTPDCSVIGLTQEDQTALPHFVAVAHQNGVKPLLSIGGWTGSQYFSTAVATPANRTLFVQAIVNLVITYKLNGIDFDWEYPNQQGIGLNTISPSDSANFLLFLQTLRSNPIMKKVMVTAAVPITPFAGPTGAPLTDVSEFASVLDYISLMNYDIWGPWSQPGVGPNAPLDDSCSPYKAGSAVSAVNAWTSAGFPAGQIVLGVPSYGRSYFVSKSNAIVNGQLVPYPPFDPSKQPHGDSWDYPGGVDPQGNLIPPGGIFNFWGLVQGKFLTNQGTAPQGIIYRFDSCSQTPYVYNPKTQVMVSYDDAQSFAAKGNFITQSGLRGFAMYHVAGDFNDILLSSIRTAAGF